MSDHILQVEGLYSPGKRACCNVHHVDAVPGRMDVFGTGSPACKWCMYCAEVATGEQGKFPNPLAMPIDLLWCHRSADSYNVVVEARNREADAIPAGAT